MWTDDVDLLIEKWFYGHVFVGSYCNEETIGYIVKYLHKTDEKHKGFNPKVWCSGGIGSGYLDRGDRQRNIYAGADTKDNYIAANGKKLALPIYYRNKIYNDDERESLWMYRLDKKERWVNGQRVDISENYDDYYKTLKEARKLNTELGYGDDEKDWNKLHYDNQVRKLGRRVD